ncbi:MAG: hypothetical protein ACE5DI_00385 [Candidatus Micrarchaeia archaeon]
MLGVGAVIIAILLYASLEKGALSNSFKVIGIGLVIFIISSLVEYYEMLEISNDGPLVSALASANQGLTTLFLAIMLLGFYRFKKSLEKFNLVGKEYSSL